MSNTPAHGSDHQVTPDWWQASDGRFYPPELHPDYVPPAAPAPPAPVPPAASPVADAARTTIADTAGGVAGAAAAAAAAGAAAASAVPSMPDMAQMPTMPSTPDASSVHETIVQQVPSSPATPPAMPAPGLPTGQPPAMPSAPSIEGPGGITYTPTESATPDAYATMPSMPPAPGAAATQPGLPGAQMPPAGASVTSGVKSKVASTTAGAVALLAGVAAIAGSLLQWGKGSVTGGDGVQKAIIEVAGFDSNGMIAAVCGAILLICGILFFMGVPKQLNWAILAFLVGAVIVGSVVFSMIDIGDLSNRYAAEWQNEGLAAVGDVISTQADLGLWLSGAGGVLGVLAAPFANRR